MLDKVVRKRVDSIQDVPSASRYLQRIGAKVTGMRTAKILYYVRGYEKDLASISFSKDGKIFCNNNKYAPSDIEEETIQEEIQRCSWPEPWSIASIDSGQLPDELRQYYEQTPRDVFVFRDLENKIVMLQVKVTSKDGIKSYKPWTFWDDGRWRKMNPDGFLPLWGAERIRDKPVVFVHEGAKAARHCHELINLRTEKELEKLYNHPWSEHLQHATHVGWIGGAHNPHLTDWSVFKRCGVRKVYIVADNDVPGRSAVPQISKGLDLPTFVIQFNDKWPVGFDLADDFPDDLYRINKETGQKFYKGPDFEECVSSATWATEEVESADKKKKVYFLRDSFRDQWYYVQESDRYVCGLEPTRIFAEKQLNNILAPYSHVDDTTKLINKTFNGSYACLCYDPSSPKLLTNYNGKPAINIFVGSKIKPFAGSYLPWLEYLEYMFPIESERHQIMRWVATLIAKPGTRIGYGLLLVSRMQGIGKTTLGQFIIPPLVGRHNSSQPSASIIVETNFNSWLARKRFIFVDEIYQGQSWKAYNKLKSALTDREVMINEKGEKEYVAENWGHFMACSNSYNPLKIEDDDRRWFYPKMTEIPWPGHKFLQFRNWLMVAGLRIIMNWAMEFEDYIGEEERAPMTEAKRLLIGDSRSEATTNMLDFVEAVNAAERPLAFGMKDVYAFVRPQNPTKSFDTDRSLRTTLLQKGGILYDRQLKINGKSQEVLINPVLFKGLGVEQDFNVKSIRNYLTTASNFMASDEGNIM